MANAVRTAPDRITMSVVRNYVKSPVATIVHTGPGCRQGESARRTRMPRRCFSKPTTARFSVSYTSRLVPQAGHVHTAHRARTVRKRGTVPSGLMPASRYGRSRAKARG